MRYINKREVFIEDWKNKSKVNKSKVNEAFDMGSSGGPLGNDINWGDSLIGRLISSSIRVATIKYNAKKVDTLLKDFKAQLDIILIESLARDNRSEFFILQVKAFFNRIDNVCFSTKDEKAKLRDLLGSDVGNNLFDPKNPDKGNWDEWVKDGLLMATHDRIQDIDEEIMKVAGLGKDSILGTLTVLIDTLREYAYKLDNPGYLITPRQVFFIKLFGLLKKHKDKIFDNQSFNFKIKSYFQFIKEQNSAEENPISLFRKNFTFIQEIFKEYSSNEMETPFSELCKYIKEKDGEKYLEEIYNDNEKIKKLYLDIRNKKPDNDLAVRILNLYKNDNKDNKFKIIPAFKESMKKCLEINLEKFQEQEKAQGQTQGQTQAQGQTQGQNKELKKKLGEDENKIDDEEKVKIVDELGQDKTTNILTKLKDKEMSDEDKKEIEELLAQVDKFFNEPVKESYRLNENVNALDINGLWVKWIEDTKIPKSFINVSQQEIDKLDAMLKGKVDSGVLTFNPKKTPDPIINIIRIFKRAHDLYYTDVIPSGRTGGKVSNKTFRQYEKLGTGTTSQNDANSPGYGPWAVKKIRNAWVDGVTKIIEDQEYRKIFANKNFRVLGSEDTFNESLSYKRYIKLILEDSEDKSPKSQGQILFDFITDMLSKETAANFDKERNVLLKKYFGSSIAPDKAEKGGESGAPRPPIPTDPAVDKTLFWYSIQNYAVKVDRLSSKEGPIIMLPVAVSAGNTVVLKFHIIGETTLQDTGGVNKKCYFIEIFETVDDWKTGKYDTFKIDNDDEPTSFTPKKGFGIINKKVSDDITGVNLKRSKINLVCLNNNSAVYFDIEVKDSSATTKSFPSVLYKKDGNLMQVQEEKKGSPIQQADKQKLEAEMKKHL